MTAPVCRPAVKMKPSVRITLTTPTATPLATFRGEFPADPQNHQKVVTAPATGAT
jgi:hypothetical protein